LPRQNKISVTAITFWRVLRPALAPTRLRH
jgi:hypothetical protein